MIDIGTGDGRFVSTHARLNPNNFYIGIDANVKPLEKPSMRATRKPSKGGLPNAMFVQASVEDLPEELNGVANKIHINFPWGSLLRAVATGDEAVLCSLRRIAATHCMLEVAIGVDAQKDKNELERLNVPAVSEAYLLETLLARYQAAGFSAVDSCEMDRGAWSRFETSWARRLSSSDSRKVFCLLFRANP